MISIRGFLYLKSAPSLLRILLWLLLVSGLLLPSTQAYADKAQLGPNNYIVGVPTKDFVHFAAPETRGRQLMQNWCWAACIQMVLNYHGLYVTQEQIVTRVYGAAVDRPATPAEIIAALSGWAPDTRGRWSEIIADPYNIEPETVIDDLTRRWPLIVGLAGPNPQIPGHAYVLTAAYYYLDEYGDPQIYRVVLRDPYPTSPSRIEMPIDEFVERLEFATRVYVKRL